MKVKKHSKLWSLIVIIATIGGLLLLFFLGGLSLLLLGTLFLITDKIKMAKHSLKITKEAS